MLTATIPAETQLAAQIHRALGFRYIAPTLSPHESATCVTVWSCRELDDVYARVGGTVTARPVTRRTSDGDHYDVIERSSPPSWPTLSPWPSSPTGTRPTRRTASRSRSSRR
jgi:hypothetical protein